MILGVLLLLAACKQQQEPVTAFVEEPKEDAKAKAMLQGIWIESESEDAVFRVEGDTIYYPDPTDLPVYFRIVSDSLVLNLHRYPIIRQDEHIFWFKNQSGEVTKLIKSVIDDDTLAFTNRQPEVLTITEVMKTDSVVHYGGERYHWYIAYNPTRYRVIKTTFNNEGVAVDNVYFDNIIHVSLYHGAKCLYSHDIKKQMYVQEVPQQFLEHAILGNLQYRKTDDRGVYFDATLCIPDEASCYMVETLIGFDGQMTMKLLE